MKKISVIIAALSITSLFLAGCGGGAPAPATQPEVAPSTEIKAAPDSASKAAPVSKAAPASKAAPETKAAPIEGLGTATATVELEGKTAEFDRCYAILDKRNAEKPRLEITFFKGEPEAKVIEFLKKTGFAPPVGIGCKLTISLKKEVETLQPSSIRSYGIGVKRLLSKDHSISRQTMKSLSGKLAAGETVKGHVVEGGCDLAFEVEISEVKE